jgi:hypothetical protein
LELNKNWAQFQKIECFKNENNQKVSLINVLLLTLYSSMKKILDKFGWFLAKKNDFESQKITTFPVLQSIQINSDEKIIGV